MHTPGPWRFDGRVSVKTSLPDDPDATVALVYSTSGSPLGANARLIAAAPDLLEACKAALAVTVPEGARATTAIIEAAIAKAEGR